MRFDLVVFDLDGTIHRGAEVCVGAAEAVERCLASGAQVRYVTNNSSVTPVGVSEKLRGMGVRCEPGWVVGTAQATAAILREEGVSRVGVLGSAVLAAAMEEAGLTVSEGAVEAVVVGICRELTYEKLGTACRQVRDGAQLVATNRDTSFPLPGGVLMPGAGVMVAAVEAGTGVTARTIGKPEPVMLERVLRETGARAERTLVVGDRMDTDMAFGERTGTQTWLVLTGVERQLPEGQAGSADLTGLLV